MVHFKGGKGVATFIGIWLGISPNMALAIILVWLITAAGAMFAAFPHWYASLFSALYIPLTLCLLGLIFRAVAIEYRGKGHTQRWLTFWTWAMAIGSTVVAFLIGALLVISFGQSVL